MKSGRVPGGKKINPYPRRLFLFFFLLTLLSWSSLEYLTWRKGEGSFFFPTLRLSPEISESKPSLKELVLASLLKCGVPQAAIEPWPERSGTLPSVIRIPLESYLDFAPQLERDLLGQKLSVTKEEKEEKGESTFLWQVEKKPEEPISFLFVCVPSAPVEKEAVSPLRPDRNRVAIIIDDMGFSLEALQQISEMKIPITIAILPLSPYARETATLAHDYGLEIMLHLPGESLNHQEENDGSSSCIRSDMGEEEIRRLTEDFLARVPFIQGVNNHMGSKITQEPSVMRPVLELLAERRLYFIDSRTTANSIAFDLSKQMGIPSAYRNVFLDTSVGVDFSRQKLIELLKLAQKTGAAVGIGHPFPETLLALKENIHLFKQYEVEPVFASQMVR